MAEENVNLPVDDAADTPDVQSTPAVPDTKSAKKSEAEKKDNFFVRTGKFFARTWSRFAKYCKNTWHEMKKVTWTSKEETRKSTLLVVVVVLAIAVAIALVDLAFSSAINGIAGIIG